MQIKTITLPLPYKLGTVNCYLLQTDQGHVLIDTGCANKRAQLEQELANAGCVPGKLLLIILTHGDFDHSGNAAHLSATTGARVAMHRADAPMVEYGDMFLNRTSPNILIRKLVPLLFGFGKAMRLTPALYLGPGDNLAPYGLDAQVLSLPGHSPGSIGILTATGDLFCGDLMENIKTPALNTMMDDPSTAQRSLAGLCQYRINTIYPGHGKPFLMKDLSQNTDPKTV